MIRSRSRPSSRSSSRRSRSPGARKRRPRRCRWRRCSPRWCSRDWAARLDLEHLVVPSGPAAGAVPEPRSAICSAGISCSASASRCCSAAPAIWRRAARSGAIVPILWSAAGGVRAARDPGRALLPHRRLRALDSVRRRWRCCSPRCSRSRPRRWTSARRGPGLAAAERDIRDRRGRGARARADIGAGERLAHRRARADGAGHRLGRRTSGRCRRCAGLPPSSSSLVMARIAWEPRIVGGDVGTTPIFNWLLYGYGIPAAAFWLGGYLLRRRADDVPARMVDAGAHPVHRAAGVPGNPPLHQRRRRLPRRREPGRDRAAGLRRARHDDRARAAARCAPAASSTTSARW